MGDIQEQLAQLRRRIARIDRKYAAPAAPPPRKPKPERLSVEEWLHGREVDTGHGCHYETDRLYERHRRHGSVGICDMEDLPSDLLGPISNGEIAQSLPAQWAFLDTETTGLAGGSGTYAFLIGVGSITPQGFRVRQFFMREFAEETSLLVGLADYLKQFDVLITYNGKTYDQPLLETRYRMVRARPPFAAMTHLDLLFGARRLWKLRFDNCRLMELENQILGVEREGDLPGELIPYVYFEYLRTREAFRLAPIFHHNAIDILTLACLTAIVPWAFHPPGPEGSPPRFSHGAEMVGLARWWRRAEQYDHALALFRQAIDRGLPDGLLFHTLWDIAGLEKKLGREAAALAAFTELGSVHNVFRAAALQEIAKHYEHHERNYARALEVTLTALDCVSADAAQAEAIRRRAARLEKRLASPRNRPLL